MSINDTDQFLVNRSNVTYTVPTSELMAELLDDDLMLVNVGATKACRVTGKEVKDSLNPPGPALDITVAVAPTDPQRWGHPHLQLLPPAAVPSPTPTPTSGRTTRAAAPGLTSLERTQRPM